MQCAVSGAGAGVGTSAEAQQSRLRPMRNNSLSYYRESKRRGKELRANMSVSEKAMWGLLRGNKLGFKFRRQHPVAGYFLDFYCAEAALCIEIDGPQHAEQQARDLERDTVLAEAGVYTVRIPTEDLWESEAIVLNRWLEVIREACESRSEV